MIKCIKTRHLLEALNDNISDALIRPDLMHKAGIPEGTSGVPIVHGGRPAWLMFHRIGDRCISEVLYSEELRSLCSSLALIADALEQDEAGAHDLRRN